MSNDTGGGSRRRPTRSYYQRWGRFFAGCGLALSLAGCAVSEVKQAEGLTPEDARRRALESRDPNLLASWMLTELLAPEGRPARVAEARKRMDDAGAEGMWPALARALHDAGHGRLDQAPAHFLEVAQYARHSEQPEAPLLAWYATTRAIALRSNAAHLFEESKAWLHAAITQPKRLGWRARTELVHWLLRESYAAADRDLDALARRELGCLDNVRMAGPFGNGVPADQVLAFAPEKDSHWPLEWDADPIAGQRPKQLDVEQEGCSVNAVDNPDQGIFYAQTDIVIDRPTQAILSVEHALMVQVNGALVLDRSVTEWGSWTKAGVALNFAPGIHRIQAKLPKANTAFRLMNLDGTPLGAKTMLEPARLPSIMAPERAGEANVLRQFVTRNGVRGPASASLSFVAAALSSHDSEPEAAALLLEPLVREPERAAGLSLALAADIVARDPIFNEEQTEDLVRELHVQALNRDPSLWQSELHRVSALAKSKGLVAAVDELKLLSRRFPAVPAFLETLARVYGELGWKPEYRQTVLLRAQRFPDDGDGLFAAAQVYDESGETEKAAQLYERVRQLDPDTEVFVGRALERKDYVGAIEELRRLQKRRPQHQAFAERIEDLQRRHSADFDVFATLRSVVEKNPSSGRARLALADAKYARGDEKSLEQALVEAVRDGAAIGPLKEALDLVEGMTELERFRLDSQQVIGDYEASGVEMPGTAARVLDYMTVWVRSDGSSRMLEHEIVRIQSGEAIAQFAEQNLGDGIVLKARVIKRDGRVLEPELVPGKPTITFPHVEIGDYIETERLFGTFTHAEGTAYDGPQWFFREQNVAYARSEFIFIAPKDRAVVFTRRGGAPEPAVHDEGYFRVYRFRVDESPAAPNEPFSVPPNEYLPNVHVGWGIDLERRLLVLNKRAFPTTPIDPRLVRIAKRILDPVAEQPELARAKVLYRWVMDNVQDGEEEDGRRVVVGKRGNRWRALEELCRSAGIPTRWVIARNALFPDPQGPVEKAIQFSENLLRVGSGPHAWVQMNERFLPFGYLPAAVRKMPAYMLTEGGPEAMTVPSGEIDDHLTYRGVFELAADGSARVKYSQIYGGRYGAAIRQGLAEVGEARARDVVETQLLARNLPGAILQKYSIEALDTRDEPLEVNIQAEISRFARKQGKELRLAPPFAPRLSQFATLATRQTPLLMRADQDWRVQVRVALPPGARVEGLQPRQVEFGAFKVMVSDRVEGDVLVFERTVHTPAGRIPPENYAGFVRFTRDADNALTSELRVVLP